MGVGKINKNASLEPRFGTSGRPLGGHRMPQDATGEPLPY